MANTVKLSFDDGYRYIELNGDPDKTIRINPTDPGFLGRISRFPEEVDKLEKEFGDIDLSELSELAGTQADEGTDMFEKMTQAAHLYSRLDTAVKGLINSIFGYDICAVVFGADNCLAPSGGRPVFINFMETVFAWIEQVSAAEREQAEKRIGKYTAQAKQIKLRHQEEITPALAVTVPPIDLTQLTPEQLAYLQGLSGGAK